jgi:hypothetical protein
MAPYHQAYNFTSKPNAAENPDDWLAALKTNIYKPTANQDKVNLFASKLFCDSPAKKWFNQLPDKGHRQWDIVKQEFESRWCNKMDTDSPDLSTVPKPSPALVALLSTDVPTTIPIPPIASTLSLPAVNYALATPPTIFGMPNVDPGPYGPFYIYLYLFFLCSFVPTSMQQRYIIIIALLIVLLMFPLLCNKGTLSLLLY